MYSLDFQSILKDAENPYGTGGASFKIIQRLTELLHNPKLNSNKVFKDFSFDYTKDH